MFFSCKVGENDSDCGAIYSGASLKCIKSILCSSDEVICDKVLALVTKLLPRC